MIEVIKTYYGTTQGGYGYKDRENTRVAEGYAFRCTECHAIFMNSKHAEKHACPETPKESK